jgi:rhodanese-related sulfurtransferase
MIVYRLADPSVMNLWLALRSVAESRLAEVKELTQEFHSARQNDNVISRNEAASLSRQKAVLLDVRPRAEFKAGHLRGAINIPIDELPNRFKELPRDQRIVAYCRGVYCLLADEAAELLIAHGFDVVRLDGGWPEWQSEGRPVSGGVR